MSEHKASEKQKIICIIGPTASGKSARAVQLAKELDGEVISVDSRQVYRTLDIGTEKTSIEEMGGIPHHLIDIRDPEEIYSAGYFLHDADQLIADILSRGKIPILAGGTHFYFDALFYGLPSSESDKSLREELEQESNDELFKKLQSLDALRAGSIDPHNTRRLIRAIEIASNHGAVPTRDKRSMRYDPEIIVVDYPKEILVERIVTRLTQALEKGLIEEVRRVRARVGDIRLTELGLEYRVIGEYLRDERVYDSLLPALSAKLWQYARQQKKWVRKLTSSKNSLP